MVKGKATKATKAKATQNTNTKKPKVTDSSDDMDTDDLLDQTDVLLSTSDRDGKGKDSDQDTDDLLDKIDAKTTTTKKGRSTKKTTGAKASSNKKAAPKKTTTTSAKGKAPAAKKDTFKGYEPERAKELTEQYPDNYWKYHADDEYSMINLINEQNKLGQVEANVSDNGAISSMTLAGSGDLLATFSTFGSIKLWDIVNGMKLIQRLRDEDEPNIEEYYCGQFIDEAPGLLAAAGKLKDRNRWSEDDDDNHIMPCPIKIFDILTGKVLAKLEGHDEEILSVKAVKFNGGNYYISTSQDGCIIKWKVADDWMTLIESQKMDDNETYMAFTVAFLPNCGNKYFMACCDEHVRLFDFESGKLLQTFENLYSSYCDCGKFIKFLDESLYWESLEDKKKAKASQDEQYAWFVTRGVELCDEDNVSTIPNSCMLHRLVYPTKEGGKFVLEEIRRYKHEAYRANSWLAKVATNGRYLLAPTIYGQVFIFNILTGQLTGVVKNHQDIEVRDVIFYPFAPLLFTCGDDGRVCVYTSYRSEDDDEKMAEPDNEDDSMQQDLKIGSSLKTRSKSKSKAA